MFKPKLITVYTLASITKPFMMSISLGMMILVIARLAITLNVTLAKPGGDSLAFKFLLLWLPHYFSLCIPLSLFIGIILGFKRMVEDKELVIMQSLGVGLHQLFLNITTLCLILSIITIIMFGWMEPIARYSFRKLLFELENNNKFLFVQDGTFMKIGNQTFIIDSLDRRSGSFGAFFAYEDRGKDGSTTNTAKGGQLLMPSLAQDSGQTYLVLDKFRSLNVDHDPMLEKAAPVVPARVTAVDVVRRLISEKKRIYRPRGLNETELTANELMKAMLAQRANIPFSRIEAEVHYRLGKLAFLILLPFFCFPYAVRDQRNLNVIYYGIPIILIVIMYILLDEAKYYIMTGWPPLVIMWAPMGCFAALVAYRYWKSCFAVPHG